METMNKQIGDISIPKFRTVKNGLDPKEVHVFINTLIAENKELAGQLKYIDSLKKLAEKTLVEAHEQADTIKIELLNEANDKANAIIAEAEMKARAEADKIIAEAKLKSEQSALQRINEAKQEGQAIRRAAEEEAEALRKTAEKEAQRIIEEAREKGEQLLRERKELAEKEAQVIAHGLVKEAREKAEREALLIKKRAEEQIERSKKKAESELKEKFRQVYREWLLSLEDVSDVAVTTYVKEGGDSGLSSTSEAVTSGSADSMFKEWQWQPSLIEEEEGDKGGAGLYEGNVELLFPSLSSLDQMLQLIRHLRGIPRMKVLNLSIAPDKSILVNVFLETPISLLRVLESIPEVKKASGISDEPEAAVTPRNAGEKGAARRIVVTTKA